MEKTLEMNGIWDDAGISLGLGFRVYSGTLVLSIVRSISNTGNNTL